MALTFPDNMVRFIACSLTEYNNITVKNNNIFYRVTNGDSVELYLGSELLSNETELQAAIARITTNEADIVTIQQQLSKLANYDDSELRSLINQEVANREAADEALGNRITTLDNDTYSKSEIDSVVSGLNTAISGKVDTNTYNAKVAELEEAIENAATAASTADGKAETAQSTANVAKEAIDAFLKDADATENAIDTLKEIQAQLNAGETSAATLAANINQLKTDLKTEISERKAADEDSNSKIATNTGNINKNATAIADEKLARENAITSLTEEVGTKASQSDLNTLSNTVGEHTTSITTLQGDVADNKSAINAEVNRATAKENEISEALNTYKTEVSNTYETKADATAKKTELEGKITQAKTDIIGEGTDSYATWNETAYATTVIGAKKFAHDVALNLSLIHI